MITLLWASIMIGLVIMPVLLSKGRAVFVGNLLETLKGIRLRHFLFGCLSIFLTLLVTVLLFVYVPFTRVGGYYLISQLAGSSETAGVGGSGTWSEILVIVTVLILFAFIPYLAAQEENAFRRDLLGANKGKQFIGCLFFGLIHLVMMIPLATAVGLSFAGFVFLWSASRIYRKEHNRLMKELAAEYEISYEKFDEKYEAARKEPYWTIRLDAFFSQGLKDIDEKQGKVVSLAVHRAKGMALMESTRVHAVHNYLVLSLLIVVLVWI